MFLKCLNTVCDIILSGLISMTDVYSKKTLFDGGIIVDAYEKLFVLTEDERTLNE